MKRFALVATLPLIACNQQAIVEPYCGKPAAIWIPAENAEHSHLGVEHLITITHANQILVNDEPSNIGHLATFVAANTSNPPPTVFFDFDAHVDCKLVHEVRATIEKSGICRDNNCITGNYDEIPPPEPN